VIRWEGGEVERRSIKLAELANSGRADLRGVSFVRKEVPFAPSAPRGYHDVEVRLAEGGWHAAMRLILCPDRAWVPPVIRNGGRAGGLSIALYGLRSARNWGCGDLTDLHAVIDWLADDVEAGFIGLNPLHAIPNRQPFNISPYLPVRRSSRTLSIWMWRRSRISGILRAPGRCSAAGSPSRVGSAAGGGAGGIRARVRPQAAGAETRVHGFSAGIPAGSPRAAEFRAYVEQEGELLDRYATWCALDEWLHVRDTACWVWPDWPVEFRDPDSAATRQFCEKHWRAVLFHKYLQWQIELQLEAAQAHSRRKGLSLGLYHDLALATDSCGADLWAHRPFYVSGCRVGAPPDGFSPKARTGASLRPTPSTTARPATGSSRNRSAPIAGTVERCASIT